MTDSKQHDQVEIYAGRNDAGERVLERVPVERLDAERYLLRSSPGLALGAAAGDTIRVGSDAAFAVLERGGNLAVQLLDSSFDGRDFEVLEATLREHGGILDGGHDGLRVFTVPVAAGFEAIETAFQRYETRNPGSEWYFANVYADDGVTPLEWWVQ